MIGWRSRLQSVPHFPQPLLCRVCSLKILFHFFLQYIFPEAVRAQEKCMHARFEQLRMDLCGRRSARLTKRLDERCAVFAGTDLLRRDLSQHHSDLGCAVILRLKDQPAVKEMIEP